MNLAAWKSAVEANLALLGSALRRLTPGTVYGAICAATVLPVVTAAQAAQSQANWVTYGAIFALLGNLGVNLVSNQLQTWFDRSKDELSLEINERVAGDPKLRDELDRMLGELNVLPALQNLLDTSDRAWLADVLRDELTRLGNFQRYDALLSGRGAIGQGEAVVAAERSIAARDFQGMAITGDNHVVNLILQQYNGAPGKPLEHDTVRGLIARYLKWVGEHYGAIELRGIEHQGKQVIRLDLDTVYVPLTAIDFELDGKGHDLDLNHILACGPRLVISGGPGSGKTTVLQYIAWTLTLAILHNQPDLAASRLALPLKPGSTLPLPIFVPLSEFAHYRQTLPMGLSSQRRTLAAFISEYLVGKQSALQLPKDFFERLLHEGRSVILLLDGLDEVPDDDERTMVREAVQDLVAGKQGLRVVVTCRSSAYKERAVLGSGFREVRVQALTFKHVDALVTQAYGAIHPADADAQRTKRKVLLDAIEDLEVARRRRLGERTEPLVTSPLIVRLLLIVQENNRRLPDQRAELYMKAIENLLYPDYLLDQVAAVRLGRLIKDKETHLELVQYLAFHMYQRGQQQGREIAEDQLKKVFENSRYVSLVPDLIKYTRLRGTLLDWHNGTYRFLHLSFQEFLTARYLADVVCREEGIEGIANFLEAGRILDSWWREPALLAIGYLSKYSSPSNAQDLVRRLAWAEQSIVSRRTRQTADVQIAAAIIAAIAFREWSPWQLGEADLQKSLTQRLRKLLEDRAVMDVAQPVWRVAMGDEMARLGDPREAVMTIGGMQLCYVPAGPFWMGGEVDGNSFDIKYDYWIGRYPVTNAQYRKFVQAGGYADARYWSEARAAGYWQEDGTFKGPWDDVPRRGPARYRDPFGLANHPIVGTSWYEALAFCRWLSEQVGKVFRLPNEAEWEKVARGGEVIPLNQVVYSLDGQFTTSDVASFQNPAIQRPYPWQESKISPRLASYRDTDIGATSAVGCFPNSASPYGVEEMAGNVWEWTRSVDRNYSYNVEDGSEDQDAPKELMCILRGGSFNTPAAKTSCTFRNPRGVPWLWARDIGFRVVSLGQRTGSAEQ